MSATGSAALAPRFVRRTQLDAQEYRTNFRQLDCEVIAALISEEATRVTSQMSKIYLCLINAPVGLWERDGVLRLTGCEREGKWRTAWQQLVELTGVASATARKALSWMSEQAIIGYYAGKNGVGIRIFINRAASSIGHKHKAGQKNLRLVQASSAPSHASANEAAFNDSFAVRETLDTDINPHAPKNGATKTTDEFEKEAAESAPASSDSRPASVPNNMRGHVNRATVEHLNAAALVEHLAREIVPHVQAAAAREHERTREWFITHALPKAIRVSQRSAYDVLRAYGVVNEPRARNRAGGASPALEVGRDVAGESPGQPLTEEDVTALAEGCLALLEAQGQSIERTLSEMSVEAGGFVLAEDAPKVRAKAEALLLAAQAEKL